MSYLGAPQDISGENTPGNLRIYARQIAAVVNRILQGKLNAVYRVANADFTLTANAASSTFTDARVAINSYLGFMPKTANAAAELGNGTMYVLAANMNNGAWTITHANNAQTDRTFRVLIIG